MWNLLFWAVCLFLAILAGRKGKGASCGLLHGAAFGTLGMFLETLVTWPMADPKRLLLYVAAAAVNILLVIIAGAIWPKCKACGSHKFGKNNTADGVVWHCAICQTPKGER